MFFTACVFGMGQSETTIGVSRETKAVVEAQKRGGETFDSLLRKMAEQYEPEAPEVGV